MEVEDESAEAEPVRLEAQTTIGRYRLLYELGAGGMATVFLARAEGPGGFAKPVAIKRIHPHLSRRRELVEMFLDEARLASLISHPNVCNTFDFGEDQGTYYLAMEYLVGEPLNVVERRVTRDTEKHESARWQRALAKIVADACEGLHAAHEQRDERGRPLEVVHRDVSPHNIFVTYDGAVKVLDFGVAFAADRITKTVTGSIKGKLGYLAPEQLAHAPYDRRLDVWAIGIVLWEGLTGQRLFLGRTEVDTILAVENKLIPPPSSVVRTVPKELDAIALRCLSRSPEARFPTARAVARELHQFLAQSGAPLTNVEVGELVSELCSDRRDARAEVIGAIANDATAASDLETSQTRAVRGGGDATVASEEGPRTDRPPPLSLAAEHDTDIRAPGPFVGPRPAAPLPPPLAMLQRPQAAAASVESATGRLASGFGTDPSARDDRTTRITTRLVLVMIVAVLSIATVAVTALVVVGLRLPGAAPAAPTTSSPQDVPTPPPPPAPVAAPPGPVAIVEPALAPRPSAPTSVEVLPEGEPTPPAASTPPRGEPEPAVPRDRGTGRVNVVCPISVEVCLRERCAQTPTVFADVPVGRATLRLRAPDGRRWSETVVVHRGSLERVRTAPP